MKEGTVPPDRSGEGKGPRPAAAGQPREGHPLPGMHGPSGMMPPCPPALLARILDLSDAQKKQISSVLRNAREDGVPLLKEREESFHQLRKAERAPVFDEKAVSAVARSIGRIEAEMILSRAKTHARIRELLTPAQRELVSRIEPWIFGPPLPPPPCGKQP